MYSFAAIEGAGSSDLDEAPPVAIYRGCFPFKLCEVESWRSWSDGSVVFFLLPIPHHVGFVECLPHPENVNRPSSFGDIPYQLDSYFENPLLTIFQLFCVQRIRCPLPSPGLAIAEFVQLVGNMARRRRIVAWMKL